MKKLIAFVAARLLLIAVTPDKKTTIFVIGDSTAANKDLSKGKLERGWVTERIFSYGDNKNYP